METAFLYFAYGFGTGLGVLLITELVYAARRGLTGVKTDINNIQEDISALKAKVGMTPATPVAPPAPATPVNVPAA